MEAPDFWDDPEKSQSKMKELKSMKDDVATYAKLKEQYEDIETMIEMGYEENDESLIPEIQQMLDDFESTYDGIRMKTLLSGEYDKCNAILRLNAGAGGTESCDWASMLMRMYIRWCERRGFSVTYLESTDGDDAGIRSVTLKVDGEYAYGYLKNERGIHRLVRISPFDSAGKRHTSFASLDATPEVSDSISIEILDKDLKVDTYRSGGKGGQNVNKVETAVRITHIPSGVIVACQNERSQLRNKEEAMNMLRAKLYQIEEDKKQAEADRQYSEKGDIGWGNQIRSYVFQPYQMVKDLRTGVESGNIQDVMDGNLDPFIEAMLRGHKRER